jgi:hypothetical protein
LNLREIVLGVWIRLIWLRIGTGGGSCNEPSVSIKDGGVLTS